MQHVYEETAEQQEEGKDDSREDHTSTNKTNEHQADHTEVERNDHNFQHLERQYQDKPQHSQEEKNIPATQDEHKYHGENNAEKQKESDALLAEEDRGERTHKTSQHASETESEKRSVGHIDQDEIEDQNLKQNEKLSTKGQSYYNEHDDGVKDHNASSNQKILLISLTLW